MTVLPPEAFAALHRDADAADVQADSEQLTPAMLHELIDQLETLRPYQRVSVLAAFGLTWESYLTICEDVLDERPDCYCYPGGLHSLGSVASIRADETSPYCPTHGAEDYLQ